MSEINIPFLEEWRFQIFTGRKRCTTRNKRYGKPGDTFKAFGKTFKLTFVERLTLGYVANMLWFLEGATSPEAFIEIWEQLHPRAGYQPGEKKYVHFWEPVEEASDERE